MKVEKYYLNSWMLDLLQQIAAHFVDRQAYLVGGALRNLLLGTACTDWDIATDGDVPTVARQIAHKLGGSFAHMHDKASRIVVKEGQQEMVIDLSPLQHGSIDADLRERDFTINALATPLSSAIHSLATETPLALIDPIQGKIDLEHHVLRAVNPAIFQHDPLRLLRAVRFMQRYQLNIEATTTQIMRRDAHLLPKVAPERIHEELAAILRPHGTTERLRFLDTHDLLMVLIPEFIPARGMAQPGLHYWDVFDHSLETVTALERLATLLQQPSATLQTSPLENGARGDLLTIQTLLYEAEKQGIFQFATLTSAPLKLAALLHDIGKPATHLIDENGHITFYHHPQVGAPIALQIMQRLGAGTQERRLVRQVVAHHMRPGQLSNDVVTLRAIRRYFVDLGPTGIYVALVSLADHLAMRGPEPLQEPWQRHLATACTLLTCYIRERERIIPPKLIQGDELMRRLHIPAGPQVGQLLESIAEAQTDGRIHSKEEAIWFAEEELRNKS